MDHVLSGGYSLEEAKSKQSELKQILNSADFPLKQITANDSFTLNNLSREDLDEDVLKLGNFSTVKTLRIRWNAMVDAFCYEVEPNQIVFHPTKRQILLV